MCKTDFEIHFCSCIDDKHPPLSFRQLKKKYTKKEYLKTHLVWTLSKHIGVVDQPLDGMIIMPIGKFSEELTYDYIIEKLNTKNLFDFNYVPSEGDSLFIRIEHVYKVIRKKHGSLGIYMSFTFKNNEWTEHFHDPFCDITEEFKKGIIKISK